MRQETKTYQLYAFNELNEETQEKVIDKFRDINTSDSFWYECIYEDAKTIANLFGLDIDKIYFSGFWSQGDGASFEGSYEYKKKSLQSVKDYAPLDNDLHDIVERIVKLQKKHFYKLYAKTSVSGHYVHSGCMSVDVINENKTHGYPDNEEDELKQLLREFADWIYSRLSDEYDYQTKDETIKEFLEANDYEFLESGELYA